MNIRKGNIPKSLKDREFDHWHRTANDQGRPYDFVSIEKLLADFFQEAERILSEQGVAFEIVNDRED